jgi:hypothetical protein
MKRFPLTFLAVVVGITLGWATSFLVNRPEASAADRQPKWEYKVIRFQGMTDEEAAKRLTSLADEGWQYVGLVDTSVVTRTGVVFHAPVAFKRPKK